MPHIGFKHTEASKRKMSIAKMGTQIRLGCKHSEETKKKIAISLIGKNIGINNHMFGKRHSLESIEKMRIIKIGKKASPLTKLRMSMSQKGKIYSKEAREKISQALKGNKHGLGKQCSEINKKKLSERMQGVNHPQYGMRGEKSHHWKGGLTPLSIRVRHSLENKKWRESIFSRDNWICRDCGGKGYLHAHHIKSFSQYPELRFDMSNGITLCTKCHKERHKQNKLAA